MEFLFLEKQRRNDSQGCRNFCFNSWNFYFQSHIEKGNDLLEEAGVLAQSGDFEEVTGYKDLAKMLKRHLQEFSERLEETRERIEGAARCYQLLDKVLVLITD